MEAGQTNKTDQESSTNFDDSFLRQKDKLYLLALETHFLTRQLKTYSKSYNKVDKNLASLLYDAVFTISNFLENAEIQEPDEQFNVLELIPAVESEICEAHRYFRCKVCNQNVRASARSFNEHFYSTHHLKKLRTYEKNMPELKDKENNSGSLQSLSDSLLPRNNRPLPKKIAVVDTNLPKKMIDFLTTEDLDGHTAVLMQQGQRIYGNNIHVRVSNLLRQQLSFRFPEVHAYPFGSMVIGLGSPKGDLDIFIDIGQCYFTKPSKRVMKNAIHRTLEILRSCGSSWTDFEPVVHARTPILRAYCREAGIDCDLSFSNGLSVSNTALIGYFVSLQPVCKKLAMFLKSWQSNLQLGVNSYIISLLVIFYLQQKQLLPSVQHLQKDISPVCVDGWQCNFEPIDLARLKIPLVTDFMGHLIGIFKFYGYDFDHEKQIVSVLTACPEEKSIFDHGLENELPAVFDRYKKYMAQVDVNEADEVEDLFSNFKPLVIQDPFELCHNVAKGVQAPKLLKIITFMRRSHEILVARKK